jgi:hypothetical protein
MCKRSIDAHGIAIWFYSILTLSVPDEGYSRNALCTLNLISDLRFYSNSTDCDRSFFGVNIEIDLEAIAIDLNTLSVNRV